MLAPLREAIEQAVGKEREARWFPVLSTLAMTLCGIVYHLFGLSSMRAVVDKAKYVPQLSLTGVRRSTLSDAFNSRLRLDVVRETFRVLLLRFGTALPLRFGKFRHLAAIDSTLLACAPKQLWAKYRRGKNAAKAHVCFDVAKGIPEQLAISAGRVHDRQHFEQFLKRGWTYLIDRAYNDYRAFDELIELRIFFVTRLKSSAVYRVVRRNKLCRRHRKLGVISDEVVRLGSDDTEMHNDLRLVTFRAEDGKVLHFLTNRLDLTAPSIANLYRARWGIELFFKFLKRTLRAARLLARSEVGVEIHVLLALITDVLLKCLARAAGKWTRPQRHVPAQFLRVVRERLFFAWTCELQILLASVFT